MKKTSEVTIMQFRFAHNNFNVRDLERSLKFYDEALGLKIRIQEYDLLFRHILDGIISTQ